MSLRRETKPLHALRSFNLPFIVPELICVGSAARIGDPAYDLAIVTRGMRKLLGVPDGLHRLVQFYNEVAEHKISPNAVGVHEALLHLKWLAEAAEARAKNEFGGHGPAHHADLLGGVLRRPRSGQ